MKRVLRFLVYLAVITASVLFTIAFLNRDIKYSDYEIYNGDVIRVMCNSSYSLKPETNTFLIKDNHDVIIAGTFISSIEFDAFKDSVEEDLSQLDITIISNKPDEVIYLSEEHIMFFKRLTNKTSALCTSSKELDTASATYEELVFYVVPEPNSEQVITYGNNE